MIPTRTIVALAILAGVCTCTAGAQSVRGTVSRDGQRLEGAVVLVLDSTGRVAARAVTRESGEFAAGVDRPGRYALRVLRIGFAPTIVGPLQLSTGAPTPVNVQLTGTAVRIAELRIEDRAPCQVRPDSDAVAFRLWEQARTALLATSLTQREPLTMRTSITERSLDPRGERVLAESTSVHVIASVQPFASLPPDSLARVGYVIHPAPDETMFWAPDADVLLSESFASTHCLRPVRPPPGSASMSHWIGIAFLPSGEPRGIADVEGVLWLDRTTAELRRLDYHYVNLPELARLVDRVQAGGQVEFLRLPNGSWIVPRWFIRYPLARAGPSRASVPVVPGMRREMTAVGPELAGVRVTAGEVSEVRRGARTLWERGRVGYRVRVMDAGRNAPIAGSLIVLDDPRDTVTSGPDGVALFQRVLPGVHRLSILTPVMTLLGASPLDVEVSVPDDQPSPWSVEVPPEQVALAKACGPRVAARQEALLRGSLRTSALPVADARVEASWPAVFTRLGGGPPLPVPKRIVAKTNARGEFVMCGLPRGRAVTLRAVREGAVALPLTIVVPPEVVALEQRIVVDW